MRRIDKNASRLIAWLGLYDNTRSALDFEIVKESCKEIEAVHEGKGLSNYVTLRHTFERHFWTRVWVVQEFVLAEYLTIKIGSNEFSPEDDRGALPDIPSFIREMTDGLVVGRSAHSEDRVHELFEIRTEWQERHRNDEPMKLYEALTRFCH